MPDRSGHTQLKTVEIHICPPNPQQLAYAQSGGSSQQNQGALACVEFGEEKVKLSQFENIRNALSLHALTQELAAFLRSRGIQLGYNANIAPALGISYGGRIALLPGQSKAEEFSTLVHELAHELLHKAERRTATTKTVRETEAEAVAFVVARQLDW